MTDVGRVQRSAAVAWSPGGPGGPLLALGTKAGALDASFSNTSSLEIFALPDGPGDGASF